MIAGSIDDEATMAIQSTPETTQVNGTTCDSPVDENDRILSIQSHVAYGYVGGKAAVFPLQCIGYDVDVVNTVNFSNHTGYERFGGTRASAEELSSILKMMDEIGLLSPHRLLTGYIPNAAALEVVKELAQKLKSRNPHLIYLMDPVLGDSGKLYVSQDVIPIYKVMFSFATIITPNWFEVETLTGVPLLSLSALHNALSILHKHVQHVIISSIPLQPWLSKVLPETMQPPASADNQQAYLLCISSSRTIGTSSHSTVHARLVPLIAGYFSGVGDLFSALALGHFNPSPTPSDNKPHSATQTPLSFAAAAALHKTHSILEFTNAFAARLPPEDRTTTDDELDAAEPVRKLKRMRGRELRLVQGQHILREEWREGQGKDLQFWDGFWDSF
ncbi:bud site selection protein 16 [Suillus subalutaceus]|uniref:bud site selection protein 16 n=1 Tax=Suillus subalutaceus TaxID=48586 RepID=UPI001B87D1A4|nr:bud site selection protein 16 [Suillus subalutaceus]KAG1857383.1 bud site selection protein 16 [Suillus subalutaceus]